MNGSSLPPVALVAAVLFCGACGDVCETGAPCARECPVGGVPICAAHGLCACLAGPDLGPGGDRVGGGQGDPGPSIMTLDAGGTGGRGEHPDVCRSPAPGDLVINEVMLDGEPTEDAEFVELVSRSDMPLALVGISLTSNRGAEQVRRVEFTGGCLPPRSAVAMYADRGAWVEPPSTSWPIEAELRSFGFANGGDFDFRLLAGDVELDRLVGSGDAIRPGVSLNRDPDLIGPPAPHPMVADSGRPSSPGRCPGGGGYADGCVTSGRPDAQTPEPAPTDGGADGWPPSAQSDGGVADGGVDAAAPFPCDPPSPGDLRINEVLIDGRVPRTEADEFVEIVNTSAHPRRLRGVGLGVQRPDDIVEIRVAFVDGCLPGAGVLVVRPDPADWQMRPAPEMPPIIGEARLALGNESRLPIVLTAADGAVIDRFDPGRLPIVEGVSLNRLPELTGRTWTLHDRAVGADSSPATCMAGQPFVAEGCPPIDPCRRPSMASVVINEVRPDDAEAADPGGFIELVNPGAEPVGLGGLSLWTGTAGAPLEERVTFVGGCLPPGGLALFGVRDAWSGVGDDLDADVRPLALGADGPAVIELRYADETWSAVLPPVAPPPGVSFTRLDEGDGRAAWVRHDDVSDLPSSPGMRRDGTPFGPGVGPVAR